jgi:hypothetical protein
MAEPRVYELEQELTSSVASMSAEDLAHENEILTVLYAAQQFGARIDSMLKKSGTPALTRAMLMSAKTETRSQAIDSRTVHRKSRLMWDILESVFGSAAALKRAIDKSRPLASDDDKFTEVLQLADRYLGGWRPGVGNGDDD